MDTDYRLEWNVDMLKKRVPLFWRHFYALVERIAVMYCKTAECEAMRWHDRIQRHS